MMKWLHYWKKIQNHSSEYRYKKPQFVIRGMDRIKRLSYEVLEGHKLKFGEDFADNKKALDLIAIVRSKGLKNEIAGYITKFIKKENREEKAKQSQIESSKIENYTLEEKISKDDTIEEEIIAITSDSETSEVIEE